MSLSCMDLKWFNLYPMMELNLMAKVKLEAVLNSGDDADVGYIIEFDKE